MTSPSNKTAARVSVVMRSQLVSVLQAHFAAAFPNKADALEAATGTADRLEKTAARRLSRKRPTGAPSLAHPD